METQWWQKTTGRQQNSRQSWEGHPLPAVTSAGLSVFRLRGLCFLHS